MKSTLNLTPQLSEEVRNHRASEYPIDPVFLNRWSSRAYNERKVSEQDLYSVLEAAHWAPSSFNDQPWRFILARTEEQLSVFHSFINDFNLTWAQKAPVLIVVASKKLRDNGDPNSAHTFDAGTAWGYLALQANSLGLVAHAMGGFSKEKARIALNIPDELELHAVIALGYQGDSSHLPEALRLRDIPNQRLPLHEVITEGSMN
jgi:nitroreductase